MTSKMPTVNGSTNKALTSKSSGQYAVFQFLTHLLMLALYKSMKTISRPLTRIFSVYYWIGKNFLQLQAFLLRQLLRCIGWWSNPMPRSYHLTHLVQSNLGVDLKRWHVGLAGIFIGGVASTIIRQWRDSLDERLQRRKYYKRLMAAAASYEQWKEIAESLYKMEETDLPATEASIAKEAQLYDRKLLQNKTSHMKRIGVLGNAQEIMFAMRIDLTRNIANIAKSQLHDHFIVLPKPIQAYLKEAKEQLMTLANWSEAELSTEEKISFFRETRHTFGRTALLLSGGGGLGTFHIGVAKTLFEQNLLPRVLAGSSVGSIVCAIVATRTDVELRDMFSRLDQYDVGFFQNSRAVELVHHLINKGSLQDISYMVKKLRSLLGDLTFLEAYHRTGRILNVTVSPADTNEPPRLLNYLSAPHALVWSGVAASSAFPGLFPAQHLLARNSKGEIVKFSAQSGNDLLERRWRDGSLELDLPVQALGEMFNCNHFLVSQTNPHIVPLLNFKRRFSKKWANILEAELKHRCQLLQWMLPEWLPSKWLMLFTQPWEGDVTMILPAELWLLGKTIVNPTTEELLRSVKVGEVATWEKLSGIECNCSIEATLDKCLARITMSQQRSTTTGNMGSRMASWMHLPMSLTTAASFADNIGDADTSTASSWGMGVPQGYPVLNDPSGLMADLGGVEPPTRQGGPMSCRRGQAPSLNAQNHGAGYPNSNGNSSLRNTLTTASSPSLSLSRVPSMVNRGRGVGPSGSIPATTMEANSSEEGGGGSGSESSHTSGERLSANTAAGSAEDLLEAEIMQLATCDNESGDIMDLWGSLLPLASQINLNEMATAAAQEEIRKGSSDGLDVYAF